MKACQLFEDVDINLRCPDDEDFSGISISSQDVKRGDLFVALKGGKFDGHDYARDALRHGAKYVLCERDLGLKKQIVVDSTRSAYAIICRNFFQKACQKMKIIAISGTNGKTSVCHLCGQIFSSLGCKVGVIGTLGAFYDGKVCPVGLTTPDPEKLHQTFFDMWQAGVQYVFMEASAHAIFLHKLDGIDFEVGLLTNITQDHLDFFGSMDKYAQTKLSFFDRPQKVVTYADDEWSRALVGKKNVFTYGMKKGYDFWASRPQLSFEGAQFYLHHQGKKFKVKSALLGEFNVQNLLGALAIACLLGLDLDSAVKVCPALHEVDGRTNVIRRGGVNVIVDYAHTPDGLEKLLRTAWQLRGRSSKIITIFGCGGNRDKTKRPLMGKIASENSDYCILTSDNPRYEKPLDIIADIEEGMSGQYQVCADRAEAISRGIAMARPGDIVIIAGKGAEDYQEINGQKMHFSDKEQVYNYFALRKVNL